MSVRMDANMFVGQYPFRSMAAATVADCALKLTSLAFDRAVVSPMEAIFQEDSFAAERDLAHAINGSERFIHFKIVNPMQPWWQDDLKRGMDELGIRGIRLCGNYHGCSLYSPEAAAVLDFAAENTLPVLVMCRMQDYRMQWMIKTPEPTLDEVEFLLTTRTDNKLILAGLHMSEMQTIAEKTNRRDNVLLDMSRLKGGWKTFDRLTQQLEPSRIAFGSLWPINLPDCPLEQIKAADLDGDVKENILGGNLCRLLGQA